MKKAVITLQEYQGFQRAYDFFNRELFAGSLLRFTNNLQRACLQLGIVYFAYFWKGTPFNRRRKFYVILITANRQFWIVPLRIFRYI
jgi:hypothetical protein